MTRRRSAAPVPASAHTEVLAAAYTRATTELEDRLTEILEPILAAAGKAAAAEFRRKATDHLTAAALRRSDLDAILRSGVSPREAPSLMPFLVADGALAGVTPTSTMVCVKPRPEEADAIADPGGAPAEGLHVTLAVLLDLDESRLRTLVDALKPVGATHAPLSGRVGGYGEFRPPGCGILLPDVPGLVELRVAVTEALVGEDLAYARDHGYQPHITVDGKPEDGEIDEMLERTTGAPLHFDAILVVRGDAVVAEIPLVGPAPVTAAASLTAAGPVDPEDVAFRVAQFERAVKEMRQAIAENDPVAIAAARAELNDAKDKLQETIGGAVPAWSAPAGDEVLDVQALAQKIRAKTEPVRRALIETTMTPALEAAGLSFDVTNPLTQQALASTGAKVTGISETTRGDVMKVVQSAWQAGLSIDHTAEMLSLVMQADARTRARTIARTELVGAVNGGSLAATQLVASATGSDYLKSWLTAPGAPHPRHELYDGLDGQTVALDEKFDVGGAELDHPGDPDGEPGEVINCRCTMRYVEADQAGQAAADEGTDGEGAAGEDVAATESDAAGETTATTVTEGAAADAFVEDSAVPQDLYHYTATGDSAASITSEGFTPSSGERAVLGDGVYFATDETSASIYNPFGGHPMLTAKADVRNPFLVSPAKDEDARAMMERELRDRVGANAADAYVTSGYDPSVLTKSLQESGYDAVKVDMPVPAPDAPEAQQFVHIGGNQVVVFDPADVRVVVPASATSAVAEEAAADSFSADIGVTPFRAGEDQAVGFYESDKYGQFVSDVHDSAASYGVTVDGLDKVTGVWQGDTEPSVSLRIHDGEKGVRAYAANLGNAYHQDGVLIFGDHPAGDVMATFQNALPQDKLTEAMAKAGIDGGRFTADGRLQVIGSGPDFVKQLDSLAADIGPYDASAGRFELLERDSGDYGKAIQEFGPPNAKTIRNTFDAPTMWGDDAATAGTATVAPLTESEATAALDQGQASFAATLDDANVAAVNSYVSTAYTGVNSALRTGAAVTPYEQTVIDGLDATVAQAPPIAQDMTLWRGVTNPETAFGTSDLGSLVGKTITDPGFGSTSLARNVGVDSARGGTVLKILAPAGTKGVWVRGLALSRNVGGDWGVLEHEFILPRGSAYKVVAAEGNELTVQLLPKEG